MRLTAPVYQLRRKARLLSREGDIPLHQALDRIAAKKGFTGWSLLVARRFIGYAPATKLYWPAAPGDLVLVGARPGHGKTLMSLELAVEAMKSGSRAVFFTLEYTEKDVLDRFRDIGVEQSDFDGLFEFDNSDTISADYIVRKLAAAPRGTLVVIDYLQLLDQKRENPELMAQLRTLQSLARAKELILVFISQIDRSYDPSKKPLPIWKISGCRIRRICRSLTKTCFLNNGEVRFRAAG